MLSAADLERLRQAPWLHTPGIRRVFSALATTGGVSRAVGGAVRNTLLGEAIDDVDIATSARPDAALAAAARAGLIAIPTGLAHGTVTLVADGQAYEVTTLRRDVGTDGRHATVAFTDDWSADASRRDFTINALYCDPDGTLFDPLGGCADLRPARVRFIGDAAARIREDYLRILRFFRFSARYAATGIDAAGLAACGTERAGLARISAERIRTELMKLLITRRAAEMCTTLQAHGFLVSLLGAAPAPGRLARMMTVEVANGRHPDAILRLAALAVTAAGDMASLARRLKLSGAERHRLQAIASNLGVLRQCPDARRVRALIYEWGAPAARDSIVAAWVASEAPPDSEPWRRALAVTDTWVAPVLPINGQDVILLGTAPGPRVGRLLAIVDRWWVEQDFMPDRTACLQELRRLAAAIPN